MSTVSVEIPSSALLHAVEQLDSETFEQFLNDLLLLRARRTAPSISEDEVTLLRQINTLGLTSAESIRLQTLLEKAERGIQTVEENREQQLLSEKSEEANAQRMNLVAQLATLWGKSLDDVLQQLGLWNRHGGA